MPLKMFRKKSATPKFWETHWKKVLNNISLKEIYSKNMQNQSYLPIFEKHLPVRGKIIEAGCGVAMWVYVLKKKGYDIKGIDYAEETINFVKEYYPNLPVKVGDVFNLDYPDSSIRGYISLGVVEHFEEGPQEILREAYRVLDNGGVLICSVPYFNPLRRIKKKLGLYNQKGEFYQYAFTRRDIKKHLTKAGFEISDVYYSDVITGLEGEIRILKPIIIKIRKYVIGNKMPGNQVNKKNKQTQEKRFGLKRFIDYLSELRYSRILNYMAGNMIIMVASKKRHIFI